MRSAQERRREERRRAQEAKRRADIEVPYGVCTLRVDERCSRVVAAHRVHIALTRTAVVAPASAQVFKKQQAEERRARAEAAAAAEAERRRIHELRKQEEEERRANRGLNRLKRVRAPWPSSVACVARVSNADQMYVECLV